MSLVEKIENLIFMNFKEGDVFTNTAVQDIAVRNGIIPESNSTAVNNALYGLKNDIRLKKVGRGQYQIVCRNDAFDEGDTTEKLFEQLIGRLKSYKKMNPIDDSKDDMMKASMEVEKYRKYMRELQKIMNNK